VDDASPIEQPWKVNSVDKITGSNRHRIEIHDVETPWGDRFLKPRIVSCFDYVSVVPMLPNGDLVLIRQYRHAVGRVCVEFPAGGIDTGEVPLVAAKRELAEETLLSSQEWTPLGRFAIWPDVATQEGWFYLAGNCVEVAHDQHEPTEPFTASPEEARRLFAACGGGQGNMLALMLALDALR
jgi:8-oxo-dGTP pyrophosphatase MutT (NUDIX family)